MAPDTRTVSPKPALVVAFVIDSVAVCWPVTVMGVVAVLDKNGAAAAGTYVAVSVDALGDAVSG
jgi:hypothetical protein